MTINQPRRLLVATAALALFAIAACSDTSDTMSGSAASQLATATLLTSSQSGTDAGMPPPGATGGTAQTAIPASGAAPSAAGTPAKLNLNTATREQFLTVPNVGDRMVREFLRPRPF